jgi:hypothetical protein
LPDVEVRPKLPQLGLNQDAFIVGLSQINRDVAVGRELFQAPLGEVGRINNVRGIDDDRQSEDANKEDSKSKDIDFYINFNYFEKCP